MHIFITGATGLIGSHLYPLLNTHEITVLTRNASNAISVLSNDVRCVTSLDDVNFNTVDVVINLAGEPIVSKRWSDKQKNTLINSRVDLTHAISNKINSCEHPPHTFISGSAVGYYGRQNDAVITEDSTNIHDEFTHQLCKQWEQAALTAQSTQTRVCLLRTGIVLAKNAGALAKMLPAFKLGLGGPIGHGSQGMSWIHINDMTALIMYIINTPSLHGAINATAPKAVSNMVFTKQLGHVLARPTFFKMPAWGLNLAMGEMADLLTTGQFVYPKKALEQQFSFKFTTLLSALNDILK
ncbi:TIGR01777 family oxidoreductase [Pseudoalteromonas sp. MMG010]|uniref:TIGR01777 family oxidoreductase n=1 Tax=Pseudoalteromonas sp. MMG010 TaxID=2822685 RepID=UPI001B3A5B49|nr:TIGR01777 family oxidoreductase [Pseudoalteromonas sp. MMG010]MBQ4833165.1 TIGR01777 family oxidoreductase [Pseudoalteromonas sp. MMG010]